MRRPALAFTITLLLALATPANAAPIGPQDDPAPPAADTGEVGDAATDALRSEMEAAYMEVAADFAALRGADPATRLAALDAVLARLVADDAGPPDAGTLAAAWAADDLLGPIVSRRVAAAVLERLSADGGTPTLGHLRAAVDAVFPEATVDRNWDAHFLDLDVVRRWRELHGTTPPGEVLPDDSGREPNDPPPPPEAIAPPDPADMVLIPRGELAIPEGRGRGWPDFEQKAERRTVRAFYIDRHEVSIAAYAAFLRGLKRDRDRRTHLPDGWILGEDGSVTPPEGPADRPVTGVSYPSAWAFADALDKRLPTEDEWERAARGDDGTLYPWGAAWAENAAVAGGVAGPRPRGSAARDVSGFGVVDLAGNVSEFCATLADGKTIKRLPKETDQVVRRGGNFEDSAEEAANDYRFAISPATRSPKIGFRCAMDERDYQRYYAK